jgi:hypothetical protein
VHVRQLVVTFPTKTDATQPARLVSRIQIVHAIFVVTALNTPSIDSVLDASTAQVTPKPAEDSTGWAQRVGAGACVLQERSREVGVRSNPPILPRQAGAQLFKLNCGEPTIVVSKCTGQFVLVLCVFARPLWTLNRS